MYNHLEVKTAVWMFKLSILEILMEEDLSGFVLENKIPMHGAYEICLLDHPDNYAGPVTARIANWIRENIIVATASVWIEVTC